MASTESRGQALLVEDEALVALGVADMLQVMGFNVLGPAPRVAEAMVLIDKFPSIAVGVLDINLAGERSWPIAFRLLDLKVPFLFLTGYVEVHAEIPPEVAHAPVCYKPADDDVLRRIILDLLA